MGTADSPDPPGADKPCSCGLRTGVLSGAGRGDCFEMKEYSSGPGQQEETAMAWVQVT